MLALWPDLGDVSSLEFVFLLSLHSDRPRLYIQNVCICLYNYSGMSTTQATRDPHMEMVATCAWSLIRWLLLLQMADLLMSEPWAYTWCDFVALVMHVV